MIASAAGLLLALSGLGVLALLGRVSDARQRALLRGVAWFDLAAGALAVLFGALGVMP